MVKPYNRNINPNSSAVCAPLVPVASSNAQPKLKAVEIDGETIDISEFTGNEYSYALIADRCVLPVVKGITSDNGLYTTTDYTIAEDGKSAVATVTVKNLFTQVTPAVYRVNISLDSNEAEIKDHVTGFKVLKNGTAYMGKSVSGSDPRLSPYTGSETTAKIPGASWFDTFGQRKYSSTNEILGLENCIYLMGDNALWCKSDEWCGSGDYLGADDVAWMTFDVNKDCDVIIAPRKGFDPHFVTEAENGWEKSVLSDLPFRFTRLSEGVQDRYVSNNLYIKSFKAGDTVTLYNSNVGKIIQADGGGCVPYHVFVRVH